MQGTLLDQHCRVSSPWQLDYPSGSIGGETTKGVFQCRPVLPRNTVTWDTSIVLDDLKHLDVVRELSLKSLTLKTGHTQSSA